MQAEAPEAIDLSSETKSTRHLYGLDNETTRSTEDECLMARRLVERGVRFVQLYHGAGSKWDSHSGMEKNHSHSVLRSTSQLSVSSQILQRGLLDETLVKHGVVNWSHTYE